MACGNDCGSYDNDCSVASYYKDSRAAFLDSESNKMEESNKAQSKLQTIKIVKDGPTYLYAYLNIMYGDWKEFEQRSFAIEESHGLETNDSKNIKKYLKLISKNSMYGYKRGRVLDKLKASLIAFNNSKYHNIILTEIIDNIIFFSGVIVNKKVNQFIKGELY